MSSHRLWQLGSSLIRQTTSHSTPLPSAISSPVHPAVIETIESPLPLRLRQAPRAGFRTLPPRRAATIPQRYGTANEPPPHIAREKASRQGPDSPPASAQKSAEKASGPPKPQESKNGNAGRAEEASGKEKKDRDVGKQAASASRLDSKDGAEQDERKAIPAETEQKSISAGPAASTDTSTKADGDATSPPPTAEANAGEAASLSATTASSVPTILAMGSPAAEETEEKPPHLHTPPHVHHFDTFTLVRALQDKQSFTEEQAVTIMKAVRALLADNMELARAGILSKSDAEMESYVFRAACNELRTEIKSSRSTTTERMRTERTTLMHEVDILSQRIGGETGNLKDELKGMFDDRKMSVRMDKRDVENKIQELNYHITSRLNSEMRSEVEGLRWVLVRRTAIAIVIVAGTALVVLRINSSAKEKNTNGTSNGGRKRVETGIDGRELEQERERERNGLASMDNADLVRSVESGVDPSLVTMG